MRRRKVLWLAAALVTTPVRAADAASPGSRQQASVPVVALTFDDLPLATNDPAGLTAADVTQARKSNRAVLNAVAKRHAPATGFVIQQRVDQLGLEGTKILNDWIARGHDLGNHLYSHADINSLTLEQAEAEIIHGEPAIAQALSIIGRKPRFLRFPQNHTGDTREKHDGLAAFMVSRGYRLAPCTIDNDDYDINGAYLAALHRRDASAAGKILTAYVAFTASEVDWYSDLDRKIFGYLPPHVMLLHVNALNRDAIESILNIFVSRGFKFVTLDQALKDPAYAVPETFVTKFGPMWGYRWARELNVHVNGRDEPEVPVWIAKYEQEPASP